MNISIEQLVREVLTAAKSDRDLWKLLKSGVDPMTLRPSDLIVPANRLAELMREGKKA